MFHPVNTKISFPELENEIIRFWKDRNIFQKSLHNRTGSPQFTMYDGPPTANGKPGIHHVLSRVYKDIIPRYRTMKGSYVPRKAGWDTHGLPVELEIEKKLKFTSKADIENYGVAQFNKLCRESVFTYLKEWDSLTERIGFWIDLEHPYITLENSYIESCWWAIKELWDKGLVYHGYKVTPHCPRCGTSLSSHEVALGYRDDTVDPSVYIKFKVIDDSARKIVQNVAGDTKAMLRELGQKSVYFLAWTTTPWTLPGNTALAVSPELEYSVLKNENEYLILASARVMPVGFEGYTAVGTVQGNDLAGMAYEPLFNPHSFNVERRRFDKNTGFPVQSASKDNPLSYQVIAADFVSMEDGTGIVHVAPAFGEVDFKAGEENELNFVQNVDLDGNITGTYPFAGKFVKKADPLIIEDLSSRGLLYRRETITHTYPFCWRCDAPLLYYAKRSWYIRTTAKKQELIDGNATINWYPDH
ncbi:MAG TPA: isoleucine--tRNA ligase, partial [Dehalococcoidia bacterium]|nr:isoleucine--tRNA ligase [Dehalococcoidia bacterium]